MKEGVPDEVDGIDVTNVPEENLGGFLDNARHARSAEYAIKTSGGAAKIFGKEVAEKLTGQAKEEKEEALSTARYHVAYNEDVDIDVARAEMERASKKEEEKN